MDDNKTRELTTQFYSMMHRIKLLFKKSHTMDIELPPAEFHMMMVIARCTGHGERHGERHGEGLKSPGITMTQLSEKLETTLPAGSRLLRNLEKKGMIDRLSDENDRRVSYVRLSEKGLAIFRAQIKARDEMTERIVQRMGEENMEILLKQLQNLYCVVKEEMEEWNSHD